MRCDGYGEGNVYCLVSNVVKVKVLQFRIHREAGGPHTRLAIGVGDDDIPQTGCGACQIELAGDLIGAHYGDVAGGDIRVAGPAEDDCGSGLKIRAAQGGSDDAFVAAIVRRDTSNAGWW